MPTALPACLATHLPATYSLLTYQLPTSYLSHRYKPARLSSHLLSHALTSYLFTTHLPATHLLTHSSHLLTHLPATYSLLTCQPSVASSTAFSARGSTACSTARCASTAPSMCAQVARARTPRRAQRSLKYGWPQAATLMGSPCGLPVWVAALRADQCRPVGAKRERKLPHRERGCDPNLSRLQIAISRDC